MDKDEKNIKNKKKKLTSLADLEKDVKNV